MWQVASSYSSNRYSVRRPRCKEYKWTLKGEAVMGLCNSMKCSFTSFNLIPFPGFFWQVCSRLLSLSHDRLHFSTCYIRAEARRWFLEHGCSECTALCTGAGVETWVLSTHFCSLYYSWVCIQVESVERSSGSICSFYPRLPNNVLFRLNRTQHEVSI